MLGVLLGTRFGNQFRLVMYGLPSPIVLLVGVTVLRNEAVRASSQTGGSCLVD